MTALCALLGVTKQAYYKPRGDKAAETALREELVVQFVLEVRSKDPGMGGRKLWEKYRREMGGEIPVGRDRFSDILHCKGLNLRMRVRAPRTTDSAHCLPTYPDLVRGYVPGAPDRLIVCDITYITIWSDEYTYAFCYLSLVMDAYTKEIVGWCVGETLEARYTIEALLMALEFIVSHGGVLQGLIHHSDRGCQYASREYTGILRDSGVLISMTEGGDPKDNAQAERINSTIKNELLKGMTFHSIDEVREAVAQAVDFYNNERPHMSLDMLTPVQARYSTVPIEKRWRSYREEAIYNGVGNAVQQLVPLSGVSCRATPSSQPHSGFNTTNQKQESKRKSVLVQ